ncbi:MAG: ABC transporter substrate-binding protein [Acidimicrobiales bacterium]
MVAGAGLVVVGGGASSLLAACSSDSKTTSSTGTSAAAGGSGTVAPASLGKLSYQLSWVKNVEFAGSYIADSSGYYKANGFDTVDLIAGGQGVTQDAVVAENKALICTSAPDITGSAIVQGAEIIAIGAQYQKNPFCILSVATNPINTPQDMIGKTIGVQSTNQSVWTAFLKANDIQESQLTTVPAGFDPTPVTDPASGIDGWFSFVTNEPIAIKEKGFEPVSFLLNDYNYPLVSQIYVTQKSSLDSKRDMLKAFLKSEIQGWHDSLKDPAKGAQLTVDVYGKDGGLNVDEQTLESQAQNKLILDDRTKTEGIFTIADDELAATMSTLDAVGIALKATDLFDLSVLEEVYAENPDLKVYAG